MIWHDNKLKAKRDNNFFKIFCKGFSELMNDTLENLHDFVSEAWMTVLFFLGVFSGTVGACIIYPLYKLGGMEMILQFFIGVVPTMIWFMTPILGVAVVILIISSYKRGIEGLADMLDN